MTLKEITQDLKTVVHGPVYPAEIRTGEPVKALIKVGANVIEARVWRLSPMGVEIICEGDLKSFKIGDLVDLEICIGVERTGHFASVVADETIEKNFSILGLRFHIVDEGPWAGEDRRISKRWGCSSEFLPNGVTPNPGRFNDFIFFKVLDISSTGMKIQTSLRNKFLVRGLNLQATITCPTIGNSTVKLKIENANIIERSGKEFLALGCSYQRPSKYFLGMIAQYIFQFGSANSLKELREAGLDIEQTAKGVEYKYIRTKDEYEEVLELRKLAYGAAGKLASEKDVSDIYDSRSRIIVGVYKGKIVASTRLIFNETEDQMEHEQFLNLTGRIPNKSEICEITRVCTHPDFRGSDLLAGLLKFVGLTVAQSGRRYILGCATDSLLPMYLKIGFRDLKIKFTHKSLNDIEHTLFLCDINDVAVGKGVGPIAWNLLWADVVSYVAENQILKFDPASNFRIGIYRAFSPIARLVALLLRLKKKKRSKRKMSSVVKNA